MTPTPTPTTELLDRSRTGRAANMSSRALDGLQRRKVERQATELIRSAVQRAGSTRRDRLDRPTAEDFADARQACAELILEGGHWPTKLDRWTAAADRPGTWVERQGIDPATGRRNKSSRAASAELAASDRRADTDPSRELVAAAGAALDRRKRERAELLAIDSTGLADLLDHSAESRERAAERASDWTTEPTDTELAAIDAGVPGAAERTAERVAVERVRRTIPPVGPEVELALDQAGLFPGDLDPTRTAILDRLNTDLCHADYRACFAPSHSTDQVRTKRSAARRSSTALDCAAAERFAEALAVLVEPTAAERAELGRRALIALASRSSAERRAERVQVEPGEPSVSYWTEPSDRDRERAELDRAERAAELRGIGFEPSDRQRRAAAGRVRAESSAERRATAQLALGHRARTIGRTRVRAAE